jgi:hypothetical protein
MEFPAEGTTGAVQFPHFGLDGVDSVGLEVTVSRVHWFAHSRLAMGLALLTCFVSTAFAQKYSVSSVSAVQYPSNMWTVFMYAINDSGQIAGYGETSCCNYDNPQAFISTTSGSTAIPLTNGFYRTWAYAINNSGQVTGAGGIFPGGLPNGDIFIGTTSGSTPIPLPSGWSSLGGGVGFAINDSGIVAGVGPNGSGNDQAFTGTASGSTAVPLPSGWTSASGYAINSSGQVAGLGVNSSGNSQAFIGTTSRSTPVPMPSGWIRLDSGYCCGINDSGLVTGSGFPNSSGFEQAFIGTTSGSTAIPLATDSSNSEVYANSLSNTGLVVGNGYGVGYPWIWDATDGTVLLSTLMPAGWGVNSAIAVSPDGGLILATASFNGGTSEYVVIALQNDDSVTFTPTLLNFGNEALYNTSKARTVTMKNTGTETLHISGVGLALGTNFAISNSTCAARLAPNKTCRVSVTFTPTALGPASDSLSFTVGVASSPLSVPLSGTGEAQATLTPASHTFPHTKVGSTSLAHEFTLKNNLPTTLSGISYSTAAPFAVSTSTCGTTLNSKATCTISVTFSPSVTGTSTGTLTVTDSANSPQTSNLIGTGH